MVQSGKKKLISASLSRAEASLTLVPKLFSVSRRKTTTKATDYDKPEVVLVPYEIEAFSSCHNGYGRIKLLRCLCPKMWKTVSTLDGHSPPRPVSLTYVAGAFALATKTRKPTSPSFNGAGTSSSIEFVPEKHNFKGQCRASPSTWHISSG